MKEFRAYDLIQNQNKFSFPTHENHQICNEECKTSRNGHIEPKISLSIKDAVDFVHSHSPDQADPFQECDEASLHNDLLNFEQKCLPGGSNSVILYTTSLRGIRKTFGDCQSIKFLLDSFQIIYQERDISMSLEFREELWEILGGRVIPPRLFIKGRLIGGADEVLPLHEGGMLKSLLRGIPLVVSRQKCRRCNGVRFVLCCNCHGGRKIFHGEDRTGSFYRCQSCNENGLIKCPLCF